MGIRPNLFTCIAHILVLHTICFRLTLFTCIVHILVLHTISTCIAHILVLYIIGYRLTLFTCIAHILVLHTMTCTAHYASYIKALMYILYFITVKYNTNHSVFLTWNQSRMNICRGMMSYILSNLTVIITSPSGVISFSINNTLNMISIYFTF